MRALRLNNRRRSPLLTVTDLAVNYGGVQALRHLDLEVADGAVHGLIGPNGAGKSTALNAMTGVTVPTSGSVHLKDLDLLARPPHRILEAGLSRTFQQAQLWSGMTVEQNLMVPLLDEGRHNALTRAHEVANELGFSNVLDVHASDLPFGARRLVEVARAIMTRPRMVMLDEPGAGLTGSEKSRLIDVLHTLSQSGTSVLLVDHDMDLVMRACEKVTVLDAGVVIAEGDPDSIRNDETVLAVYLGHK